MQYITQINNNFLLFRSLTPINYTTKSKTFHTKQGQSVLFTNSNLKNSDFSKTIISVEYFFFISFSDKETDSVVL